MPIKSENRNPPFNITRLSHVVLSSKDLDKTRYFYETGLGLEVTFQDKNNLYLRCLEEPWNHSLIFQKHEGQACCFKIGYRVFDEDDLNKAKDFFDQKEIPCKFSKRQFQGNTIELDDIVGVPLEFCATMDQKEPLMRRFDQHTGGRCAFLDHIQISTHDVQSAFDWYSDLGFRLTEYTAADGTDELWGVWLKRKYNTQDVVYSNGEGPMLHHIALHTPEIANVIHCADAMASLGLAENMDRPPGRHGIGNAFFIYFRDPDGHRVEIFTSHYAFLDSDLMPKRWDLSNTKRSQVWGFPAPKKWFYEGTSFVSKELKAPLLKAAPVTLEDFLEKLR